MGSNTSCLIINKEKNLGSRQYLPASFFIMSDIYYAIAISYGSLLISTWHQVLVCWFIDLACELFQVLWPHGVFRDAL